MKNNVPCETCITLAPCKTKMRESVLEFLSWGVSSCPEFRKYINPVELPNHRLNIDSERLTEVGKIFGFSINKHSRYFSISITGDKHE